MLLLVAVAPSVAQATVTQTSITTPADPYYALWNEQQATPNVTISGTSNGTTGDAVDILCYDDNGSTGSAQGSAIASNVSVAANGSFTTSVPLSSLAASGYSAGSGECRLRAVPHSTAPGSGLSAFTGPRSLVGYYQLEETGSSVPYDYTIFANALGAQDQYTSFGECGIVNSYLNDPTTFGDANGGAWGCNDYTQVKSTSDSSLAGVEVDGQAAYAPGTAGQINTSAAGFPALAVNSVVENPTTGDLTIDETDPLVYCQGQSLPTYSCSTFVTAGVSIHRVITQTANGHTITIADSYSSTDGSSHVVDLRLENDQEFVSTATTAYMFPGQSTFSVPTQAEQVPATGSAPATVYIENTDANEPSTSAIRGAITYYEAPSGPFSFEPEQNASTPGDFDTLYSFTVPATGSVPIKISYTYDYTLAAVKQEVATAEDANDPPSVAITSPATGTTVTNGSVTVSGTASAGSGVRSVTVNGVTATLTGSTWTATIALTSGQNTVTVVVTSETGATATATETIDYSASTPTSTTTTTTPAPISGTSGVGLSAKAMTDGLSVSGAGGLVLPLVCPQTATGCDADGILTLALATPKSSHALYDHFAVPIRDSVLATFSGIEIETGQSRLVSVKLTPAATRYLQTRGIRRVQVTLTIHNHLSGGAEVTTHQQVWLNIAALAAACPAATGTLTASSVASMRLGLSRRQARRLGPHRKARYGFVRYCLTGGAVRVAYTNKPLLNLNAGVRGQRSGRVVLVLTGNLHYSTHGIHARMTVTAAQKRLNLGEGYVIGKNTWYFVATRQATTVIKARAGVVREIGIANVALSHTPAQQLLLLRHP